MIYLCDLVAYILDICMPQFILGWIIVSCSNNSFDIIAKTVRLSITKTKWTKIKENKRNKATSAW